jgi:hypothetical protein
VEDERRFRKLWKALDRRRRWEIIKLAFLGREAPDPDTAWFVVTLIRRSPWGRARIWLRGLVLAIASGTGVGLVMAAMYGRLGFKISALVNAGLLLIGAFAFAVTSRTFPRALQLNEPIARRPGVG